MKKISNKNTTHFYSPRTKKASQSPLLALPHQLSLFIPYHLPHCFLDSSHLGIQSSCCLEPQPGSGACLESLEKNSALSDLYLPCLFLSFSVIRHSAREIRGGLDVPRTCTCWGMWEGVEKYPVTIFNTWICLTYVTSLTGDGDFVNWRW